MELIDHMPVTRRDGKLIVGEGVKFERIRRITGYLVARWIGSTTPNERK